MVAAMNAHFETYETTDGFRWRLVAGNGEIVSQGEAYTSQSHADRGIHDACRAAIEAADEPIMRVKS
jgi:uncharacterized protein YegP (UPF0339 family)